MMASRVMGAQRGRRGQGVLGAAVALALTPALFGLSIASRMAAWAYRTAGRALALPQRMLVWSLLLVDGLIADVLAFLTRQPGVKAQLSTYQQTVASLQHTVKLQQRQIMLLNNELDGLKLDKSKAHMRNLELADKVQLLQQQLSKQEAGSARAAAVAAAAVAAARPAAAEQLPPPYSSLTRHEGGEVKYDAKSWYLHACVVLASIGVRWWLLHQTDPLQRKVMLVVIWPIAWVYGAMVFNCLPRSSTLRAAIACCCWALLGYVAHEMVSFSVRERQQGGTTAWPPAGFSGIR